MCRLFFDVVMLVILLHSLCTCQEQSQNVGTFLSKKSWLRVRAKKWQICVGSRLHILCYSGSIRVWASPYRLVHSEVTLTKNALKKCPCQICLKIYMRSKTLFLEIYTFSSVSTATEWKSGPVGCCCRCYPGRILSPHSSAPRSDQRSPRRRGRKWWRIIRRRSLLDCSSHTLLQSKTPNTPKTANYAKKAPNMQKKAPNTPKYSKFSFTLFCREKILFQIHALFGVIYRPKKYGGVPKGTNIRYVSLSKVLNCRKKY